MAEFLLPARTLSVLGIILNELVTNSIKHAFPADTPGLLRLSARIQDGQVRIGYSDDGRGLPPGVNLDGSSGFGLRLVGLLVSQLGGKTEIERDRGTRYTITFPMPVSRESHG